MSKALVRLIVLSSVLVLIVGLASKIIIKDQVIALSPPELIPTPTPIPTPYSDPGPCFESQEVLHVYPPTNASGCTSLGVALLRAAISLDGPKEVYVHAGAYDLNTQDFAHTRSPSFALDLQNVDDLTLKGETGSNGENLVTINVSGNRGLFLLENSSLTLESLNFSGSTINGLLHAESGSNLAVTNVHSTYTGSNVFEAHGANSVTIYKSVISGGVGALQFQDVGNTSIIYNTIINNSRGIIISNGPAQIKYNLLVNNSDGESIHLTNSRSSFISNNTIVQSRNFHNEYPLKISQPFLDEPTTVQYNILSSVDGGLEVESAYESAVNIQRNNIYTSESAYKGISNRTGMLGNISSDPFLSPEYCLLPNSPSLLPDGLFMGHTGLCESPEPTHDPNELFYRIDINPGQLTTTISTERILFSAQAVPFNRTDESQATYEWGMSSDNSIGTLFSDPSNQKQAWFTPVRAGRGDIWVTVRIGDYHKTASVPVVVNKLCQEKDSCTTDACIAIVPPGGWCASQDLPGDVDFNNTVDYQDIVQFKRYFNQKYYPADFNFDGKVNIYDFLYIIKNFGLSMEVLDEPLPDTP